MSRELTPTEMKASKSKGLGMKGKIGVALVFSILVLPMMVNAQEITTVRSSEEVGALSNEGWYVDIYNSGSPYPWWTSEKYGGMPTVNEPAKIKFEIIYLLEKSPFLDGISMEGPCKGEIVFLDIYKGGVLVDHYIVESDSNGDAEFTVTFREPGYYRYESCTEWQRVRGDSCTSVEFYVKLPPTPMVVDSDEDGVPDVYDIAPYDPNVQTPGDLRTLTTLTPSASEDSDSDGVPDQYDYDPYDPEVQTKSDVIPEATPTPEPPGFEASFAVAGLLAVAVLFRRRRYIK